MKRPILAIAMVAAASVAYAGISHADCRSDLEHLPSNFKDIATEREGNMSARDMRRLRQAARILSSTGHEEACEEIVDVLESVTGRESGTDRGQQRASSDENRRLTEKERTSGNRKINQAKVDKARSARPVMNRDGSFSINRMVGAPVYSAKTGARIGEVEDIVMGRKGHSVIIGHGGLLGLGEKRIKVAIDDLKVDRSESEYYIAMTTDEIETEPAVENRDGRWIQKPIEANRQSSLTDDARNDHRTAGRERDRNAEATERGTGRELAKDASDAAERASRSVDKSYQDAKSAARSMVEDDRSSIRHTGSINKVAEMNSTVSANELIGEPIYSSTSNEKVGEIEDLVVSVDGTEHNIIIGHGGFLGLGEKNVKVRLSDVSFNSANERYYIAISDRKLKQAQGLEKEDGKWAGKPVRANDRNAN